MTGSEYHQHRHDIEHKLHKLAKEAGQLGMPATSRGIKNTAYRVRQCRFEALDRAGKAGKVNVLHGEM